jgi:hypothetical protein
MDWVNDTLAPEVWHLELTPIERITKLNIIPIIQKIDSQLDSESHLLAGLQNAVMIGERLFLLGTRQGQVFNVYFEVPLHNLCGRNS